MIQALELRDSAAATRVMTVHLSAAAVALDEQLALAELLDPVAH